MINTFEDLVQEKVDFIPDYKEIKSKINVSKYIKKNKLKEKLIKKYWKLAKISLSILVVIIITSIILIKNSPLEPEDVTPIPDIEKIENTSFDGYLNITQNVIFQDDKDTIVLDVEVVSWSTKKLKSLYIKGNSLDIISAQAFGNFLEMINIDNKEYYYIDLIELNLNSYKDFKLFLNFDKNSCYKNSFYSDIVSNNIITQSFDIYINYGYEETEKQNLRFYYYTDNIYGDKILCYNNIDELLENGYFKALYLANLNVYNLSKELIYFPGDGYLFIRSRNYYRNSADISEVSFSLGVWISDTGIMYGDQPKITYFYNGIEYQIISHEAYITIEYSIDFSVKNEETNEVIQYSFLIKANSIDKVKEFIRTISLYSKR